MSRKLVRAGIAVSFAFTGIVGVVGLSGGAEWVGASSAVTPPPVIDTVLAKDRDFLQWRAEHPDSFVPRNLGKRHNRRPAHMPVRALSDTAT